MSDREKRALEARLEKSVARGRKLREQMTALKAENRSLEKELRESHALLGNVPGGLVLIQDDKLIYVNGAVKEQLGYGDERILGRPFTEFIHPDSQEFVTALHKKWIPKIGQHIPGIDQAIPLIAEPIERILKRTGRQPHIDVHKPRIEKLKPDIGQGQKTALVIVPDTVNVGIRIGRPFEEILGTAIGPILLKLTLAQRARVLPGPKLHIAVRIKIEIQINVKGRSVIGQDPVAFTVKIPVLMPPAI